MVFFTSNTPDSPILVSREVIKCLVKLVKMSNRDRVAAWFEWNANLFVNHLILKDPQNILARTVAKDVIMKVQEFFDENTFTITYVVSDEKSGDAVIIDPVLGFCPITFCCSLELVDKISDYIRKNNLNVRLIIETHAHADHLSAASELKKRIASAKTVIGRQIVEVQETFKEMFNFKELKTNGQQFDILVKDGDSLNAGSFCVEALHTPGHTPACHSYLIGDAVFAGDALFMPDFGVGRCDFPGGSASDLYRSVTEKLYKLDESTRVFTGHDYQPNGRLLKFESSIAEEKKHNVILNAETSQPEFIKSREDRDSSLPAPKLLFQSIQYNINGGHFPLTEGERTYLKIPVTQASCG